MQPIRGNADSRPDSQNEALKALLRQKDPAFYQALRVKTREARSFDELFLLASLRKKAEKHGLVDPASTSPIKLALIGGCSLYPLSELIEHELAMAGFKAELFKGDFDNYTSEILDASSALYAFGPELVFLIPSQKRCRYSGKLSDARAAQQAEVETLVAQILGLCENAHSRSRAEILLANFIPPAGHDLGSYRARTLGSDWSFRKQVNLELGLRAPSFVHVCDLEFLASRHGTLLAQDRRAWYESKQLGAPDFLAEVAKELAELVAGLRKSPKKLVVLDLDDTLWGGIIGDDGLEGIEIGDTSPRGEAFKAFQSYLKSLGERGVLLAICSKNDYAKAAEPFEKHPEMVLKLQDFVAFKANWNPKSENLREIAAELNLGLDSFVFVDDNRAEIEIVRQFVPEVETIWVGADPSRFVSLLEDSRYFEPRVITAEDGRRAQQYKQELRRKELAASATDMTSYLKSLGMEGAVHPFRAVDVPRICQLINKSNQFNLTTRRRTEAEVQSIMQSRSHVAFSVRLLDKFGDHGLIAVVIGEIRGETLEIDTWLMSCRVLKRQVEEETVNAMVRLAKLNGCKRVLGAYLPTPKNDMVRELYPQLGFRVVEASPGRAEFEMEVESYEVKPTAIVVTRGPNDPN